MAENLLKEYRSKRDFSKTSEPSGAKTKASKAAGRRYLVQKHAATRLHYDFRLEHNGVLLSWAVTRGPSLDPHDKRLAVHVEDHPVEYGDFEGTIPKGEYGGGTVMLWDEGSWEPITDPDEGLKKGELKFIVDGKRLKGRFVLVRMKPRPGERSKHENWLLIKERDEHVAEEKTPLIERVQTSVRSGRSMDEIAAGNVEWTRSGLHIKGPAPDAEADSRQGKKKARSGAAASGTRKQEARSGAAATGTKKAKPAKRIRSGRLKLPKFVSPQLATLVDEPPDGDQWVHEIKYDGYRLIAATAGPSVAIYTRKGLDWTVKFPSLVQPIADLPCEAALLDGEVAVTDEQGHTSFGTLQDVIGTADSRIGYFVFDLLELDGEDLTSLPLVERKAKLAALLADQPSTGPLFYSDHVVGQGREVFENACEMKLEGIISKLADAPYRPGRTKNWLKVKCAMGQEFIIVGWQPSDVQGRPFSSLLLGVREGDRVVYRGRVGSGFGERTLSQLGAELRKREVKTAAVEDVPRDARRGTHFVKPELVAEIAFRGWTDDGVVRQASYKGLRRDKKAAEVIAEIPKDSDAVAPKGRGGVSPAAKKEARPMAVATINKDRDASTIEIEGVRVTHPDRVLFPGVGVTKRRLIEYYLAVQDHILPHIVDRPLSLVRCPDGAAGDCFFQKHASAGFPDAFKPIRIREKTGSDTYLYIEDVRGLVASVQIGVLELHLWGSHVKTLEQPDRVVFDFDPDEDLDFAAVREAAKEMRDRLAAIDLQSFAMASGGKGLHVVVPLRPKYDWDDVRGFAEAIARTMAADDPRRYLAVMSKSQRKGKIFVDYLRNGRGATAIAPFSSRVRKNAPLAWPVAWGALARLKNAQPATVETAAGLLKRQKQDPWAGYFEVDQVLPLDKLRGR